MGRVKVLLFITLASIVSLFGVSGNCQLNDCLCTGNFILCNEDNEAHPLFTPMERNMAQHLTFSVRQGPLIAAICDTFPYAQYVEVTQSTRTSTRSKDEHRICPRLPCKTVKVICQ